MKAAKEEIRFLIEEIERTGRDLARRYEVIKLQTSQLQTLPSEIEGLEAEMQVLRQRLGNRRAADPSQNLPLEKTVELLEERNRQNTELDRLLEQLQREMPAKTKELEAEQKALKGIERQMVEVQEQAREAVRRKQEGKGDAEGLEERGRWYRSVEAGLKGMLEV